MDSKTYLEAMFESHRTQMNRLESKLENYQTIQEERIKDLKEGQNEIRNQLEDIRKSHFCRVETCEKKFLPRWLLTITIAALVFIGSIGLSNKMWIVAHETQCEIEQQIEQNKAKSSKEKD